MLVHSELREESMKASAGVRGRSPREFFEVLGAYYVIAESEITELISRVEYTQLVEISAGCTREISEINKIAQTFLKIWNFFNLKKVACKKKVALKQTLFKSIKLIKINFQNLSATPKMGGG